MDPATRGRIRLVRLEIPSAAWAHTVSRRSPLFPSPRSYGMVSAYAPHGVAFALLTIPYALIAILVSQYRDGIRLGSGGGSS